jgi:hypothetical protein
MSDTKVTIEAPKVKEARAIKPAPDQKKPAWETPTVEDVSEQVMAQPYIRFT